MKRKNGIIWFLFALCVVLIPYGLTMQLLGKERGSRTVLPKLNQEQNEYVIISDVAGEQRDIPLEECLTGMLPAYLELEEMEAVKALAVLVRTSLYQQMEEAGSTKLKMEETGFSWLSVEERKRRWGKEFADIFQGYQKAVAETEGEVLVGKTDKTELLKSYFHKLSAGVTREREGAPYLKAALCDSDMLEEGFLCLMVWKKEEYLKKLEELGVSEGETGMEDFQIFYDTEPYVEGVTVGGKWIPGEEWQRAFGLRSPAFEVEAYQDGVRMLTRGMGNGYGLSLQTAGYLAEQGMDYKNIVQYFFEAEIEKYPLAE